MTYTSLQEAKRQLQHELGILQTARGLVSSVVGEDVALEKTIGAYQRRLQHIDRYQDMMSKTDREIQIEEANKRINFMQDPVYRGAAVPMQIGNTTWNNRVDHPFRLFIRERRGMTEDDYKAAENFGIYPDKEFELSRGGGFLHWVLTGTRKDLASLYNTFLNPKSLILSRWRLHPSRELG